MANGSVTIAGLPQLKTGVDRLPRAVELALRAVAFRTAHRVMGVAKSRVPVMTGYTRDHIHITEEADRKQFTVNAGMDSPRVGLALHTSRRTGRTHTQRVTVNMLPVWLEYGTVKMQARPFMRPAVEGANDGYLREMEAAAVGTASRVLG